MKHFSCYLLIIIILVNIESSTKAIIHDINPLFGLVSFCCNDIQSTKMEDMCNCKNGKIVSPDGIFERECMCGPNCKCPKTTQLKQDDCDIIRSMNANSPYRRFLPRAKKELWVLKVKSNEQGQNWCKTCAAMEYEFSKMKLTGWKIDEKGDMQTEGDFHIRVIDFEQFEGFPSYFFEPEKDKDGNIIMSESTSKDQLSLPTIVSFHDGKVKTVHKGFLNSFGLLKLFNGQDIIKGKDDIPTR